MATDTAPSGGNLGAVLETFGGKSLRRIVAVGATIFGCAVALEFLIREFRPDAIGLLLCVFVFGLGIALGYVSMNWPATLARVEVCEGGLRLFPYDRGPTELPWDRIRRIRVGYFRKIRARPEHVVIRTTDGKNLEFPEFRRYGFWPALGTERFTLAVQRFVQDVEVDVDFVRPEKARRS